jgi:fructose-bisphosphate aldolase class II
MSLSNVATLLSDAKINKYGIGAFNIADSTMIEPVIEAAESEKAPIIIQFYEAHFKFYDIAKVIPYCVRCAELAKVPVAVHMDHISKIETILEGLRYGCTGAMIDYSLRPYAENIAISKQIVSLCRPLGVTVESELGIMSGVAGAISDGPIDSKNFTKPEEAIDFVNKTNVDSLAVAIGTVHGAYKGSPQLDFSRLAAIRNAVDCFLVLHGGSGLTDHDFQKVIETGINKINIYTQMSEASVHAISRKIQSEPQSISFPDVLGSAREAIYDTVVHLLKVFGSSGRG